MNPSLSVLQPFNPNQNSLVGFGRSSTSNLGWGFNQLPSTSNPSPSFQNFPQTSQWKSPSPQKLGFSFGATNRNISPQPTFGIPAPLSTITNPNNSRKRKGSSPPPSALDDDEDSSMRGDERSMEVSRSQSPEVTRKVKKLRRSTEEVTKVTKNESKSQADDIDLGKTLASLPHPALLSMIHSLLSSHPNLRPTLISLLPPPTLSSLLSLLSTAQSDLLSSWPTGKVSEGYLLNRVGGKTEEWARGVEKVLKDGIGGGGGLGDGTGLGHYSEQFDVLSNCTASYIRISSQFLSSLSSRSSSLPTTSLIQPLTIAWQTYIQRLHQMISLEGKMVSAETVRSWFLKVDEMAEQTRRMGQSERALVKLIEDSLRREVGGFVDRRWGAGISNTSSWGNSNTNSTRNYQPRRMLDEDEEL